MDTCIVAVNSGHERIMGYAACQENGGMALKSSNIPVIRGDNLLIGVVGNEKMLTDLKVSPLILNMNTGTSQAIDIIRNSIKNDYDWGPQALILTMNNFLYHWHNGYVSLYGEFDEGYMSIGRGSEVAMGAIYGLRSSRYTAKEQVEVALKAVTKFYPHLGHTTGVLTL